LARKKSLRPAELVKHIVASTPSPQKFKGDPAEATLGSLGVNAATARGFVRGVQSKLQPWLIDSNNVLTGRDLSVQECASALEKMASKPPMDPDDLVTWIVESSPLPKNYDGDPNATKLAALGVNSKTAHGFVAGIQGRISPWLINESDVVVAGNSRCRTVRSL
jgi:hypothetical protein